MSSYDAILFLSFGGPEGMDDVMPFLANVLRGKNVPESRMKEVAHHYEQFGGVSPINGQNRALISALEAELSSREIKLPVYWGNRNWHPMLADTLKQMQADGIKRVLTFVTSAYSSYSGCRQYLEDIQKADQANAQESGQASGIVVDKLRVFYNHPDFIQANSEQVSSGLARFSPDEQATLHIAFTAHSIPNAMAQTCQYQNQLLETCRLVTENPIVTGHFSDSKLVFQSRSGPAVQPWLEPDILDHLRSLHEAGVKNVLVHPIGFISDHMEVLYDLDTEARILAESLDMKFVRTTAAGTNPLFVRMMGDLIVERLQSNEGLQRQAVGQDPAAPDFCDPACCAYTPARPAARPVS
ncbi:MAG: ferrochelatase [Cyanobacteria bacterium REEB67]|nr:ferrochelatase [Cyanobacteria bacterium REEB67]